MRMVIYRRLEPGIQTLDYDCVSFFWKRAFASQHEANKKQ
jgi:hypothetical protein